MIFHGILGIPPIAGAKHRETRRPRRLSALAAWWPTLLAPPLLLDVDEDHFAQKTQRSRLAHLQQRRGHGGRLVGHLGSPWDPLGPRVPEKIDQNWWFARYVQEWQ